MRPPASAAPALHPKPVGAPRGGLDEILALRKSYDINPIFSDERHRGQSPDAKFLGALHEAQASAVAALEPHDTGVLAATTAFGKTVVGAWMIATRGCNTRVLVTGYPDATLRSTASTA